MKPSVLPPTVPTARRVSFVSASCCGGTSPLPRGSACFSQKWWMRAPEQETSAWMSSVTPLSARRRAATAGWFSADRKQKAASRLLSLRGGTP